MGLVTDDLREWLAQSQALPESESDENPFGLGAARSAQAQLDAHLHGLWHRVMHRIHKWIDPDWEPQSGQGDGLIR
jgi:hypothetical protein